jgi:hypothetical protein
MTDLQLFTCLLVKFLCEIRTARLVDTAVLEF